ncbi:MAG: M20 family metallopeptidase [Pseudomonadota bacterium]
MQEILELTKDLIQFKTMHSKPQEIKRCAEFIENYLNTLDLEYKRLDYQNTHCILVLPQKDFAPVLLMSHMDVVDACDELFVPLEKDQRLYGRGSLDDKYAVALSLVLLKNYLQRLGKQGRGQHDLPFGVLVTADEEIGGFNGANKALREIRTDFCIVLDGGSIEKVVVKSKGVARVKLLSRAKAALGDRPWLGENALERLIDDFIRLRTYFVKSAPEHRDRAVVINAIQAETSYHRVPEFAEAFLQIRYTESDDMERLFDHMQKKLHSEIVVESVEPLFPGGESLHLKRLLDIAQKTKVGFEDGANDARYLAQFGIKGIVWGANGGRSRHTPNEHVDIESVYELYRLLDEFMQQSAELKPVE